jgi:hypothetical protein
MRNHRLSQRLVAVLICLVGTCTLAFPLGRCGDGICERPETALLCPEDCADTVPNPLRTIVSEEILAWQDWLEDGSFEDGDAAVELIPHPTARLRSATVARVAGAARTGAFGMRIDCASDEGIRFALRCGIEKGEATRFTIWVRSPGGPTTLAVDVFDVEAGPDDLRVLYEPPADFSIGTDWTRVQFAFTTARGVDFALFALEVGPNQAIEVDDASVEAELWAAPDDGEPTRIVGGIPVPVEPAAPFHFNVLIHIEDPRLITQNPSCFYEKTAVFRELARALHEHGGFLTIQTEEDWPSAALAFAPDTLAQLVADYGVAYSTHTHGPACIDPDGRLRSNQDCSDCRTCPGWREIETDTDPYTPQYVDALRDLISRVSETDVSDHNGNFGYENANALAAVGVSTWSAFKDHNTQSTFDQLFTNPWRPTACDAIESPTRFQTHDPSTRIVFIPGWGQAITRYPERIHDRLAGMLSQVLRFADPDRVNTFYIVTHVDHYGGDGDPYIDVDPVTGEVTFHDAFLRDLAHWEETLTELVDPLVAEGYLQWTSLSEIGELFAEWEANRGGD